MASIFNFAHYTFKAVCQCGNLRCCQGPGVHHLQFYVFGQLLCLRGTQETGGVIDSVNQAAQAIAVFALQQGTQRYR